MGACKEIENIILQQNCQINYPSASAERMSDLQDGKETD